MLKKSKQKWFLSKLRALAASGTLEVGLKGDCEKISLNFVMLFPFLFPVIPGNNNVSFPFPKFGNGISIPVRDPKNLEWNIHSCSRSQKLGMKFSFPFPFPKVGNAIFHSRSRSQSLGMGWAIPVPVPKCPKVIPAHPCFQLHGSDFLADKEEKKFTISVFWYCVFDQFW